MKFVIFSSDKGDVPVSLAVKNNLGATADPGATDDALLGYEIGSTWMNTTGSRPFVCLDATAGAAVWVLMGESGIDPTELALLNGAVAGSVVASKAAAYGTDSMLAIKAAALAATGADQAGAAPIVSQFTAVTGADNAKGVALIAATVDKPQIVLNTDATHSLLVYPIAAGNDQINGAGANNPVTLAPGAMGIFIPTSATQWYVSARSLANDVAGVAPGYKIARGVHQQAAATDTIATGLATVVAAVVSFQSAPTVKQLFATADVGDQAGAPAAGSILINTFKPTAVNDVTPIAATDFTDNIKLAWVAIGT